MNPYKLDPEPWGYRQQSLVDRALGKLACAASGHRWWRINAVRVCSRCGTVERRIIPSPSSPDTEA